MVLNLDGEEPYGSAAIFLDATFDHTWIILTRTNGLPSEKIIAYSYDVTSGLQIECGRASLTINGIYIQECIGLSNAWMITN